MTSAKKQRPKGAARLKQKPRAGQAQTAVDAAKVASKRAAIERKRNRLAWAANERFLKSGIQIEDVHGTLD